MKRNMCNLLNLFQQIFLLHANVQVLVKWSIIMEGLIVHNSIMYRLQLAHTVLTLFAKITQKRAFFVLTSKFAKKLQIYIANQIIS